MIKIVNITLSIPNDLKDKMENFNEINWSAVARDAFYEKIRDLEFLKSFKSNSAITEEEAIYLGKELNKKLSERRLKK